MSRASMADHSDMLICAEDGGQDENEEEAESVIQPSRTRTRASPVQRSDGIVCEAAQMSRSGRTARLSELSEAHVLE